MDGTGDGNRTQACATYSPRIFNALALIRSIACDQRVNQGYGTCPPQRTLGPAHHRPLLSTAKATYIGTTFIETTLFHGDTRHKASAEAIGSGTLMAVEPGQGILEHRYANGTVQTYVALNKPEAWINAIDFTKPSSALECIAEEFEGWAPHSYRVPQESSPAQ